ncbi:hypothetical protein K0M31_015949 [Melipona bicolor]|uniref:Uncharacterized protein n=1 Tax=Melipona bicolor TaxID=60889 RepID=A0AA40KT45_9HYME|nr:hypothetical protein K0M31_015949 [Melipona bicolor]
MSREDAAGIETVVRARVGESQARSNARQESAGGQIRGEPKKPNVPNGHKKSKHSPTVVSNARRVQR